MTQLHHRSIHEVAVVLYLNTHSRCCDSPPRGKLSFGLCNRAQTHERSGPAGNALQFQQLTDTYPPIYNGWGLCKGLTFFWKGGFFPFLNEIQKIGRVTGKTSYFNIVADAEHGTYTPSSLVIYVVVASNALSSPPLSTSSPPLFARFCR